MTKDERKNDAHRSARVIPSFTTFPTEALAEGGAVPRYLGIPHSEFGTSSELRIPNSELQA
jgi:hypothetical protein